MPVPLSEMNLAELSIYRKQLKTKQIEEAQDFDSVVLETDKLFSKKTEFSTYLHSTYRIHKQPIRRHEGSPRNRSRTELHREPHKI